MRCIEATQKIERLFRLTITPGLAGKNGQNVRLTSGQLRKTEREVAKGEIPSVPAKIAIADRIEQALSKSDGTFPDFQKRIEALGVKVKTNTAKTTNHISGVSFQFDGVAMKGSKVARSYSWQGLKKLLEERRKANDHSRNPRPAPQIEPQSNERRATQPEPIATDEQLDRFGIELAGPGKGVETIEKVGADVDDNAITDVLMGGLAEAPIETGADAFSLLGRPGRKSKRDDSGDGEMADEDPGPQMTIS